MADRQKITFHQEGDQGPGLEPGDIVIVLDQKEHPLFQRRGNDLIVKKEIELVDALCGCKTVIHTLDNRRLLVTSRPGGEGRAGGAVGHREGLGLGPACHTFPCAGAELPWGAAAGEGGRADRPFSLSEALEGHWQPV